MMDTKAGGFPGWQQNTEKLFNEDHGKNQEDADMSKGTVKTGNDRLPFWKPLAWSSRAVSLSLNVILMGYLTFYCTDIVGLSAATVGIVLLISKLFDGFTDLIVGFIIEKTHTRLGKARPYELFVIPLWIFTVMLFDIPENMSASAAYIYIFVLYALANSVSYTFVSGNETVYLVRAFPGKEHQISLLAINGSIVMIVAIIFNIFFPQIVKTSGATHAGWVAIAFKMAVPLAIIGLFRFIFIKEVVPEDEVAREAQDRIRFSEMLRLIGKNKYTWILLGMVIIVNFISNMSAVATYYFKYIVGDIGLQSLPAMANILTPVILLLFPLFCRKFGGTTGVLHIGMIVSLAGLIIRTAGGTNLVTLVIGSALFIVGSMPVTMMIASYTAETMDYGEWKNGKRIEGPLNSVIAFGQKVGPAIASGVTGLVMGVAGYNGLAETQSASASNAIVILYNWIPLILSILAVLISRTWKMDKIMPRITTELAERKGGKAE